MKITGPDSLQHSQAGGIDATKGKNQPAGFRDMLRETLEQTGSSAAAAQSAPLPEPRGVHPSLQPAFHAESIVDRASRAIDLLDAYSNALADPGKTLRDIEPELTAFVSNTRALHEEFLRTDPNDPQLKSIMEDLLRTARLEGIRFQRGDYLDTE